MNFPPEASCRLLHKSKQYTVFGDFFEIVGVFISSRGFSAQFFKEVNIPIVFDLLVGKTGRFYAF
ncbi:MAG: hypothetical protein IKD43_03385 [Clostridia bacterium]|nr:hypothetical protein [Clostridia bacterium]